MRRSWECESKSLDWASSFKRHGMGDTSPEIAAICREMLLALTPGERLRMSFEMYELAGKLARAGILLKKPDATEVEIQQGIFLRFYERDYSAPQRDHILGLIAKRYAPSAAV